MAKALEQALRLLTRREHSEKELASKLKQKGFSQTVSDEAVAECQRLGYQSDKRFVETFLRHRERQGYGPQRIKQELLKKQIDESLIETALLHESIDWFAAACKVWKKKTNNAMPLDYVALQKMKRFLLYRGFPSDIIQDVVSEMDKKMGCGLD